MKTLILGSNDNKPGLGRSLAEKFRQSGEVVQINRSVLDLEKFFEQDRFDTYEFDNVIVNAYVRDNWILQNDIFMTLFKKHRFDHGRQLIAIGSMTHYFGVTRQYDEAKRELHDFFYENGKFSLEYDCKILLIEPGTLDTMIAHKPDYACTYSTADSVADITHQLSKINTKFMHLAVRGDKIYHPDAK